MKNADQPMLRRVRRRLMLLSGGSTLLTLLCLGLAVYWAVATSLRSDSIDQLQARAGAVDMPSAAQVTGSELTVTAVTGDPSAPGLLFGGPASGTVAIAVPVNVAALGAVVPPDSGNPAPSAFVTGGTAPAPGGLPEAVALGVADPVALMAAANGQTTITETVVAGTPVRVLTEQTDLVAGPVVVQVYADRTAELRTLQTVVLVLVVGGFLVLGAAIVFGYVYAGRALVPIRDSLRRQREFTADASHELRTPLAIVQAGVDTLRRHTDEPSAVARAADDIQTGATRAAALMADLLTLARSDAGSVELELVRTDLGELATDATENLAPQAVARGVTLHLDVQPAPVTGDIARLRQLVAILVDNAIRHSSAGGVVAVRVRPGATLEVSDTGPGIRPEDLPRVFDRFWRAEDAPVGGTGLGLAIGAWIAERHGGVLRAANQPQGGAIFTFTMAGLPA